MDMVKSIFITFDGYVARRKTMKTFEGCKVDHRLKITPNHFYEVLSGRKNFEIRKNDRKFRIGDFVVLEEFKPIGKKYSGRAVLVCITDMFDISDVVENFVAFTFDEIDRIV